jgi:hypothetical protein
MNRKLQVFISSTFVDLREERQAAVEGVLLAKHIPAGMELFTAGDASQLEVIKQWIKESDVYLLILGARYGSIEPVSGLSYSEIEYDFAVANGMPHFALVLKDTAVARKHAAGLISPTAAGEAAKLASFRAKVLSKSSQFVDDPRDIKIGVLQSLHEIELRPGLIGWLRSNEIRTDPVAAEQLTALAETNRRLRESFDENKEKLTQALSVPAVADLVPLNSPITIAMEAKTDGARWASKKSVNTTWRDLFAAIAIKLLAPANDDSLNRQIAREIGFNSDKNINAHVIDRDWEMVKAQFLSLGYVSIIYGTTMSNTGALFWYLTDLGREIGLLLRSVRSTPPVPPRMIQTTEPS